MIFVVVNFLCNSTRLQSRESTSNKNYTEALEGVAITLSAMGGIGGSVSISSTGISRDVQTGLFTRHSSI